MVKSMTGYGKSSQSINSREYQVEIKTVNHKYIDTNIRMPRIISYLEEDIRKLVSSKIKRGKVGNKLVTFDYTNNNVNINISDFYYEYDVIIDVGHGGSDTGATNIYIAEKDMNLKVSLYEKDCTYWLRWVREIHTGKAIR